MVLFKGIEQLICEQRVDLSPAMRQLKTETSNARTGQGTKLLTCNIELLHYQHVTSHNNIITGPYFDTIFAKFTDIMILIEFISLICINQYLKVGRKFFLNINLHGTPCFFFDKALK